MEHAVDEMKGKGMCGSGGIMTGKGFLDSLKTFTKKASMYAEKYGLPILKELGATVLKEILVPMAKKKIGLGVKSHVGKGINTAGMGLKLAGQGRNTSGSALRAKKKLPKKITQLPKVKHCGCTTKS
jgi:hypothetical protein